MDSQPSQLGRLSKSISNSSSQSLASILNNPHGGDASWIGWWSSSTAVAPPEFAPLAGNKAGSELKRSDFKPYLVSISEPYGRFEDIRSHSKKESLEDLESNGGQGEALVSCLREVPAMYFKEDFALEDRATFHENLVLQEKLSQNLDVVELHLVKEISLRSNSFFEAQRQLEDLNLKIVEGCGRIREFKEIIRLVDSNLVDSGRQIQELNGTRNDLLGLQQKLRLILYVNQALSALKLLVASADCAGALDVTDDLQHLLDGDELTGLHCFRHLRNHLAASVDTINSILSAEFMRTSIHGVRNMDAVILSKIKARASLPKNGEENEVKLDEEETSIFRDQILPLTIGLLRTEKLPSVLRIYRDTLTAHMKTAIKTAVADILPVLLTQPLESDYAPGERIVDADGGSSLASKLRSLSSESFVRLLEAIFCIVRAHLVRAAEVKKAIEWIICNLDIHYVTDSVSAIAHTSEEANDQTASPLSYSSHRNTLKVPSLQAKENDVTSSSNISRNFRVDVLRENTEAVFAACDSAHGRWAKLLGVRALLHPRLRFQEFLRIYNITQEFISATEKIGGRLGYSIRGTLQSQAKGFVDFQHESQMAKIRGVLDRETWVEVHVAEEFQAIVSSLFCSEPLITGHTDDAQAQSNNANNNERGNASTKTLKFAGVHYHMVNCGLILLKMLSEYIDINNNLPALSSEVVHRVVEILKFFNTRTCQLVLGTGALQVAGLKSITSKHLALASQVISFMDGIIPEIRRILFMKVPETRKALLLSEIDRVALDYKIHRDEIHTKLVQIMRERLFVHLRGLPQIVEGWNRPEDADSLPSQFARSLTKEVGYFQRVLSKTLHEFDVHVILRQVVIIFHSQISEAFSRLDISTPEARNRLHRDVQHILACIRLLPCDDMRSGTPNWGQLDELLVQRFGPEAGE
ncbi:vacuolar protein sorting-associated protein 54, chloroplastic-like isoform X1 [Camellia sinensis]|uniref:vacuolar protein sorting-associated protein 54, chloroplastic-like isoform X1 n=1 Tax=Camellia sinensis TaxID=4442 RepID=UPI001036D005|nr:vacuolar protein sorting-associated protein 54, chloroplastic-like isoform X1 [Camellia sinensis]